MATNSYNYAVNHNQAVQLIKNVGQHVSIIIEGEPGTSKSTLLKTLKNECGDKYDYIYVDVPLKDIPNVALSMPDYETQTTKDYVHSLWKGTDPNKPKIVMLDEVFKGTDYVRLMMNRLLLEKQVGDYKLPEGSIVFGTTNFTTDGVGDRSSAHTNSRVARVQMRKPTLEEWKQWAINNNINDMVLTWAVQNPAVFTSYKEYELDKKKHEQGDGIFHYIFHPQVNNLQYVCPRTLEFASHIMHKVDAIGRDSAERMLIGTIGMKAALDMTAYIELGHELPHPDDIITSPSSARIPKNATAQMMMVFKSVQYIKPENVDAFATYFQRFPVEMVSTWVKTIVSTQTVKDMALKNQKIREFALSNAWVL